MDHARIIALIMLASYFALVLTLFHVIIKGVLSSSSKQPGKSWTIAYIFGALAAASLAHISLYAFEVIVSNFREYEVVIIARQAVNAPESVELDRMTSWLLQSLLFNAINGASTLISRQPIGWWMSEQLYLYAVAWTVFLSCEGRQRRVKHLWAYLLLGQVLSMAVASNLFFMALAVSEDDIVTADEHVHNEFEVNARQASPAVWVPVSISTMIIAVLPHTSEPTSSRIHWLMHAFLAAPLFVKHRLPSDQPAFGEPMRGFDDRGRPAIAVPVLPSPIEPNCLHLRTVYGYLAIIALLLRFRTAIIVIMEHNFSWYNPFGWISAARTNLYSHPYQSFMGWDVVWCTVSFFMWMSEATVMSLDISELTATALLGAMFSLFSIGFGAPIVFWALVEKAEEVRQTSGDFAYFTMESTPRRYRTASSHYDDSTASQSELKKKKRRPKRKNR